MNWIQFDGFLIKIYRSVIGGLITSCKVLLQNLCFLDDAVCRCLKSCMIFMRVSLHMRPSCTWIPCNPACPVEGIRVDRFSTGRGVQYIDHATLTDYIWTSQSGTIMHNTTRYTYVDHLIKYDEHHVLPAILPNQIHIRVPLSVICASIPVREL